MTSRLRVAMIGHGFMGAAHSVGWRQAPHVFSLPAEIEMSIVVGRDREAAERAAAKWGWAGASDDWRAVIASPDIDVVDIVTPGDSHAEIAIAALRSGKHVLCEKPLANTVAEAEAMADAAAEAAPSGVRAMVGFTYRRVPAVALMHQLIAEGRVGRIHQVRASYRQDWLVDPKTPLTWRLRKESAGAGALGDIGAHAIDLVQYVTGQNVEQVVGVTDTVIRERPVEGTAEYGRVTVDDVAMFIGRLENGALASFDATRFATGRKNELSIEVSGDRGALSWNFEDLNTLWLYDREAHADVQGFTRVMVTEPTHPYVNAWWPAGHMLGYEHGFSHQVVDFVRGISHGTEIAPGFEEGLRVQRVLDAVERSSSEASGWIATSPREKAAV